MRFEFFKICEDPHFHSSFFFSINSRSYIAILQWPIQLYIDINVSEILRLSGVAFSNFEEKRNRDLNNNRLQMKKTLTSHRHCQLLFILTKQSWFYWYRLQIGFYDIFWQPRQTKDVAEIFKFYRNSIKSKMPWSNQNKVPFPTENKCDFFIF